MRRHYVFNNWISNRFHSRLVGQRKIRRPGGREQETDVLEEVITMTEGGQCLGGSRDCGNGTRSSRWNSMTCHLSSIG